MRTFYLYKKFSENGESVKKLAEDFIMDGDAAFAVTEHDRSFRELDRSISRGKNGDVIVIDAMHDLGSSKDDIVRRLGKIINKQLVLLSCDFSGTYIHGISPNINNIVLETIADMLSAADGNTNVISFRPKSVGRPSITFPDGWDEKYAQWENGSLSSKAFMEWAGMKKATFYNKLTEYKELLEQEEEYKAKFQKNI